VLAKGSIARAARIAALSDIGNVREENQDSYLVCEPKDESALVARGRLVIVADGMGGLEGGREASEIAVRTVSEAYYRCEGDAADALVSASEEANRRIHEYGMRTGTGQLMGSTLTALAILADHVLVAQVGDSRAYRWREGRLQQITRDHSLLRELQDRGHLPEGGDALGLHRNVLTRGLGLRDTVEVDLYQITDVEPNDVFILSSDGLHEVVGDEHLRDAIAMHGEDLERLCETLIADARARGGPDNITIAVVRVEEPVESSLELVPSELDETQPAPAPARTEDRTWFLPFSIVLAFLAGVGATLILARPAAVNGDADAATRLRALEQEIERLIDDAELGLEREEILRRLESLGPPARLGAGRDPGAGAAAGQTESVGASNGEPAEK